MASADAIETIPGRITIEGAVAPTSGRIFAQALSKPLKAGKTYTKILLVPGGSGLGGTHCWMGIAKMSDGAILAITTDDTTANIFTGLGVTAPYLKNFAASHTPVADTLAYAFFCIVATTMPSVMRSTSANQNIGPPFLSMSSGNETPSNFTTPPAVGSILTQITNPAPSTQARNYMAVA